MAQLLVRHLDGDVKAKLQRRARRHGHSTEEEIREILRNAVRGEGGTRAPFGSRLAARFAVVHLDSDVALPVEFPGGVAMTIRLTEEQQQAIDSAGSTPPQVVDPRTSAAYVLIPADDYETVRELLGEERRQKAIRKVALRNAAGRNQEEP